MALPYIWRLNSFVPQSQRSQTTARRTQQDQGDQEESIWSLGSKENPATTCKELGLMHPDLEDGELRHFAFPWHKAQSTALFTNFSSYHYECLIYLIYAY